MIVHSGLDAGQRVPLDAADVPLQRLVLHLGGDRRGRHARLPAGGRAGDDLASRSSARASRTSAPRRPCCSTLLASQPRRAPARAPGRGSPSAARRRRRRCSSAAPELGIEVTHLYGLTETYGPIGALRLAARSGTSCRLAEQAPLRARQGVGNVVGERAPGGRRGRRRRPRRRRHARRDRDARQQRDARLLPRPGGDRGRASRAAGFTPATSASCTPTATSRCATAPRT